MNIANVRMKSCKHCYWFGHRYCNNFLYKEDVYKRQHLYRLPCQMDYSLGCLLFLLFAEEVHNGCKPISVHQTNLTLLVLINAAIFDEADHEMCIRDREKRRALTALLQKN